MAWSAPLNPPAQWSVTDQELLRNAEYLLMENGGADADGTFQTDMYSPLEFLNALNDRQKMFLRETGAIVTRVTQVSTPQIPRYALPGDWIATRRLTYKNVDGNIQALYRSDTYMLDTGMADWMFDFDLPTVYSESALPTLQIEILKAPSDVGTIGLMYTAISQFMDGTGIKLAVPDEFAPYIMYGAIADLMGSDGAGKDLARATYCEMRYAMGIELAKLLMEGA
jgi:hypothetical protein